MTLTDEVSVQAALKMLTLPVQNDDDDDDLQKQDGRFTATSGA